jgi:outer membrane protein OmpA-like peptidoglycan-associated protein
MATKCKKCDPHEICEECPEWIFTLADLIMCMMGLFVILWVLKTEGKPAEAKPSQDMIQVLAGIREAFGYVPDPSSDDPVDQLLIQRMMILKHNGPGERGNTTQTPAGAEGTDREVTAIRVGPQAAIGGPIPFPRGSEDLTSAQLRQLDQIAEIIRGHRQIVIVKGHASLDDLPVGVPPERQMDLSIRRAQKVADYLILKGVSPDTLRVLGSSVFEPVVERSPQAESHARNRRVEVEVTSTLVDQLRDRPETGRPVN